MCEFSKASVVFSQPKDKTLAAQQGKPFLESPQLTPPTSNAQAYRFTVAAPKSASLCRSRLCPVISRLNRVRLLPSSSAGPNQPFVPV